MKCIPNYILIFIIFLPSLVSGQITAQFHPISLRDRDSSILLNPLSKQKIEFVDSTNNSNSRLIGKLDFNYFGNAMLNTNQQSFRRNDSIFDFSIDKRKLEVLTTYNVCSEFVNDSIKKIAIDKNGNGIFSDDSSFEVNIHKVHSIQIKLPVNVINHISKVSFTDSVHIDIAPYYIEDKRILNDSTRLQIFYWSDKNFKANLRLNKREVGIILKPHDFGFFNSRLLSSFSISYKDGDRIFKINNRIGEEFLIGNALYKLDSYDFDLNRANLISMGKSKVGYSVGRQISSKSSFDLSKKYNIIFFTGSWCAPCKMVLKFISDNYRGKSGFAINSVNYEKSVDDLEKYKQDYNITWNTIFDEYNDASKRTFKYNFRVEGYPTIFIVDRNGIILERANDAISSVELLDFFMKKK